MLTDFSKSVQEGKQNIQSLVGLRRPLRFRLLVVRQLSLLAEHTASPAGKRGHVRSSLRDAGGSDHTPSWRFGHRSGQAPPLVSCPAGVAETMKMFRVTLGTAPWRRQSLHQPGSAVWRTAVSAEGSPAHTFQVNDKSLQLREAPGPWCDPAAPPMLTAPRSSVIIPLQKVMAARKAMTAEVTGCRII